MLKYLQVRSARWGLLPERKNPSDAGLDLRAMNDVTIQPGTKLMVDTGVQVAIPEGMVGLLVGRSSLQNKNLTVANNVGIIDAGYRGNLKVVLYNFGTTNAELKADERFAQLVILPVALPVVDDVSAMDDTQWNNTTRSAGGFGSTGTN